MESSASPRVVIVPASEALVLEAFGDRVTFHLTGAHTGGRYASFIIETPPGGGPPPHRHEREDEWFLVQEGTAQFFQDGEWIDAPAGTAVFCPRGSVHTFRNSGAGVLKQVVHSSPSGFELFFARMAEEFVRAGGPDLQRVGEVAAEFGIHFAVPEE